MFITLTRVYQGKTFPVHINVDRITYFHNYTSNDINYTAIYGLKEERIIVQENDAQINILLGR
jgi:hypothetical protein